MQIEHIPLERLSVSTLNMRRGRKTPDVSDILPSVMKRGVLTPLFVRPNGKPDRFEILAGKRRYFASLEAAKECGDERALPCIVTGEGDDAEALEISMIENLLREEPDEVTQWESFTRLVKEGRDVEDIAATFALTEAQVKRILALGNLLPRIREAYRADEIDAATMRHLTLASKAQQKAWLALFDDADAYAPRGGQLKAWLFGGVSISTAVALFALETYPGQIVTDLFGEDGYFADSDAFWEAQMAEVEKRKAAYLEAGWADAAIVPPIEQFSIWEFDHAPKRKGGRVYIQLRANGEVVFHEGYVTRPEAQASAKRARGEQVDEKPRRPELTSTLAGYVDLHRHAVVREALAGNPALALRVTVAHMICGSAHWSLKPADHFHRNEAINGSVAASPADAAFSARRKRLLELLDFDGERESLCQDRCGSDLVPLFHRLLALSDAEVMEVMALVIAETLAIGSELIEVLGAHLAIDMADHWQADEAFFGLLRDKQVMVAILTEVGGNAVASANATEKSATLKGLISDHLTGANDRPRVEHWVPRWMAFPPAAYTERGGVAAVEAAKRAQWLAEAEHDNQVEVDCEEAAPGDMPDTVAVEESEPLAA
jgi:ParB family chromosome partitioning protein